MTSNDSHYSPYTLIYLRIGERMIRLADVLDGTATLCESAEAPCDTIASLIYSIDGVEAREEVILREGITKGSELVYFSYPQSNLSE